VSSQFHRRVNPWRKPFFYLTSERLTDPREVFANVRRRGIYLALALALEQRVGRQHLNASGCTDRLPTQKRCDLIVSAI
jgi:hypothetical protein